MEMVKSQYPIPKDCCEAKRKKIERLWYQYAKWLKRKNDRVYTNK